MRGRTTEKAEALARGGPKCSNRQPCRCKRSPQLTPQAPRRLGRPPAVSDWSLDADNPTPPCVAQRLERQLADFCAREEVCHGGRGLSGRKPLLVADPRQLDRFPPEFTRPYVLHEQVPPSVTPDAGGLALARDMAGLLRCDEVCGPGRAPARGWFWEGAETSPRCAPQVLVTTPPFVALLREQSEGAFHLALHHSEEGGTPMM